MLVETDDYVLEHVRAVLPDRVLEDARIVVRGGTIAEIGTGSGRGGLSVDGRCVDGRGLLVLPAVVDGHGDALMTELRPRPGAQVPGTFARMSLEGQLRAAGIGSCFHGVAFQRLSAVGLPLEGVSAELLLHTLEDDTSTGPMEVQHRVLHRVDIRCPQGVQDLRSRLSEPSSTPAVVSYEDHTPGQGQYADPQVMERWLVQSAAMTETEARDHVEQLIEDRQAFVSFREESLDWLAELAQAGKIILLGHDPETIDDIEDLRRRGGTVAEFPTTLEAGLAARERSLHVVVGAPNIIRGGSHSGNVSAAELVAAGAVDIIASDYLPSAMVAAAFELARLRLTSLPAATAMITRHPAHAFGLSDRGSLAVGQRADLIMVDDVGRWPRVVARY